LGTRPGLILILVTIGLTLTKNPKIEVLAANGHWHAVARGTFGDNL